MDALPQTRVPLYDDRADNPVAEDAVRYVNARTAVEAYARILKGVDSLSAHRLLVCQISEPDSVPELAEHYPKDPHAVPTDPLKWFQEVTDWWQCPTAELGSIAPFNHGSRIRRYGGDIDQLGPVIEHLQGGPASTPSSRATMVLLDPQMDGNATTSRMYPSMCLVQFILRQAHSGPRLDCIGYFRKQEVKYWWPINVAELAQLQKEVFDGIKHKHDRLERGTITTIAGIATESSGTPRVAIPAVDRAYDLRSEQLWDMVYSLFFLDETSRVAHQELWSQYLEELILSEERDEDGVPIASVGLKYLLTTTRLFVKQDRAAKGGQLVVLIERLIDANGRFAEATEYGSKATVMQYKAWQLTVSETINDMKLVLASIFTPR